MVVKNMQRCVYAIPDTAIFHNEKMLKLEKEAEESQISPSDFRRKLQVSKLLHFAHRKSYFLHLILIVCLFSLSLSLIFLWTAFDVSLLISQDVASGLKNEIAEHLLNFNVSSFSMAPVKVCEFSKSES